MKNINPSFMASISDKDIDSLEHAKQQFHDCYLMSSLETLTHTSNGRKILKEHIEIDDNNPKLINCYLYNNNGEKEKYTVPTNVVLDKYKKIYKKQDNAIIRTVNISVAEFENKHKAKPWYCRVSGELSGFAFEYSVPSHFMKMLTGVEPRSIGEKDMNIDLESYKDEVLPLFERMSKEKEHSFVMGTGVKIFEGRAWHVYVVQDVDWENKTITVKEKRANKPRKLSFDAALKTFKYITGYFDSDLAKKEAQQ